ncbi:MAG TPA: response regulator transcription factor [Candidatus Faecimonas intestinavium]|nr:response regulator transcription factor [Candidatus Faecimonas intestinavium]
MKIAIVEDDMKIREELSKLLKNNGYETIIFNDFENIPLLIKNSEANLVLLDINLPFENGYEICRKIKNESNIPIIFVTSRDSTEDEIMSIKVGGIDFITKPYDTIILLEKIKRAINLTDPKNFKEMTKKGYTLDLHLSLLKYKDQEIELTRNEFRILYYFFMNDERVISKEELLEKLWNDKYYLDENILLVNINRLRKKAEEIGIKDLLENVRGKGYKL